MLIVDALKGIWTWTGDLKTAQAGIVAAVLGFLTLALGHILNSSLNRRRDKFLLDLDRLNLLRSILLEITQIYRLGSWQRLQAGAMSENQIDLTFINPVSLAIIYRNNLNNIHKLPPEGLLQIIPFYVGLFEHESSLINNGSKASGQSPSLQYIEVPSTHLNQFLSMTEKLCENCRLALALLGPVVKELEKKLEGRSNNYEVSEPDRSRP